MRPFPVRMLLGALLFSAPAAARECMLPNGQRFTVDMVECAQLVPGSFDAPPPLPPLPDVTMGSPNARTTSPDARLPDKSRPDAESGLITYVNGPGGQCYAITQDGYSGVADPARCKK